MYEYSVLSYVLHFRQHGDKKAIQPLAFDHLCAHTTVRLLLPAMKQRKPRKEYIQNDSQIVDQVMTREQMQPMYAPICASNVHPYVMIIKAVISENKKNADRFSGTACLDIVHVAGRFVVA